MDDSYPGELDEARSLVESCPDCAALAADVRTIADSMSSLPTPKRTRDFTHHARAGRTVARIPPLALVPRPGSTRLGCPPAGGWCGTLDRAGNGRRRHRGAQDRTPPPTRWAGLPRRWKAPRAGKRRHPRSRLRSRLTPTPFRPRWLPRRQTTAVAKVRSRLRATRPRRIRPPSSWIKAYLAASPPADGSAEADAPARAASSDTTGNLLFYGGLVIAILSAALLALAWIARRYFTDPLLR